MVLCTGARSEKAAIATYPDLDEVCFVEVGDFTGIALRRCATAGIRAVKVVAMAGKITKLADGVMMTHFHRSAVDTQLLKRVAEETGAPPAIAPLERLCQLAVSTCRVHVAEQLSVEVLMVDFEGEDVVARA